MNENYMDEIIKRELRKETIEVPEDIKSKINDTLVNLNTRKKKKTKLKIAVSVAAIFVAFLTLGITMPAYAQNIPIIGSIFKLLDNGFYEEYDEYASDINVTKESNGVKVTISSIVYDGIDLNVAYTVERDEPMKSNPHILGKDFFINGNLTTFSSSGSGKFLDGNKTYIGVETFKVSKDEVPREVQEKTLLGGYVEVPDEFTLTLRIKEFLGEINGDWNFNFQVASEKVNGKVKEIDVDKSLEKLATDMKVNKVITTPINTVLYTSSKNEKNVTDINYIVEDDKGRVLQMKSGSGSGDDENFYSSYNFKEKYEDSKSLTFTPFTQTYENNIETLKTDLNIKGESKISIENYGDVVINKIEETGEGTKIYYNTKYGFLVYPYMVTDKESGKKYNSITFPKEERVGEYSVVFEKIDNSKTYTIECEDISKGIKIYDDLKFTVNLD
jgi:hypothetical protein